MSVCSIEDVARHTQAPFSADIDPEFVIGQMPGMQPAVFRNRQTNGYIRFTLRR